MRQQLELINAFTSGRMNRRTFAARALALGMTVPAISSIIGGTSALAAPANRPQPRRGRNQSGGQFIFGAWQDPDTLDPHTTGLAATSRILIHILDPLVWRNPADGQFYPGLAERWEVSPDGLTYTFYLRKDVMFHNGEPFTANAVKFTYDRIADPATKSLGRSQIGPYDHTEVVDDADGQFHGLARLCVSGGVPD